MLGGMGRIRMYWDGREEERRGRKGSGGEGRRKRERSYYP